MAASSRASGQALMEDLVYDPESGQLLTGSFHGLLHAARRRFLPISSWPEQTRPTKRNPLGVKGVGEAGTVGAIPAVMNAVNDALGAIGAPPVEMPATSEKVWRAIEAADGAAR